MRYHAPITHGSFQGDHIPHDQRSRAIATASLQALRYHPRSCSLAEQAEGAGLAARKAIADGWPETAAHLAAKAARYARRVLAEERES